MIDFDLQGQLPPVQKRAADWSLEDRCSIASHLYNGIYYAVTMALIREVGHERTYDIHAKLLRYHQKHFFLGGLKKLGLDEETSDAARCAKYHCMSNAVGGLRTGYAIESPGKAWLFYFPHLPENGWGGQAQIAHSRGNMMSDYIGWHGNNGTLLGNPGLRYVATHFICDGDPFDGGYFEDTARVLGPDELVVQRLGERPPPASRIQKLTLDDAKWPAERKAKALRNYAVTWAADRISSVLDEGEEALDTAVRRGIQHTLVTWLPRFRTAFGAADRRAVTAEEFATYIEAFHSIAGVETERKTSDEATTVFVQRALSEFVGGSRSSEEHARFARLMGETWDAIAMHAGLAVSVEETGRVWAVRSRS
jgi:hypothetical protein